MCVFSFGLGSFRSSYLKTKVLVSATKGMEGALFVHFLLFSFKDLFKSIIFLQLYGGRQRNGGDE